MNNSGQIARDREILEEIRNLTLEGDTDPRRDLLWREAECLRRFLQSFRLPGFPDEDLERYVNDALPRFLHTLELLPCDRGLRVLELGANPYLFTTLVRRIHDYETTLTNFFDSNIFDREVSNGSQSTTSDSFDEQHTFDYMHMNLELSDYPFPDESFDVILFCEVLEHLVVDPLPVFPKLHRLLAPGGLLIVTTPNAVRLLNFAHMLAGSNFFDRYHPGTGVYGRHNREFTVEELRRLMEDAGYEVLLAHTRDRYDYDRTPIEKDSYEAPARLPHTKTGLVRRMQEAGANLQHRGDNIYIVSRRAEDARGSRTTGVSEAAVAAYSDLAADDCPGGAPEPEGGAGGEADPDALEAEIGRLRSERDRYRKFWSAVQGSTGWRVLQFFRGLAGKRW